MRRALTTGAIAEQLGRPLWQIQYVINRRNIKPAYRVGHLRVFRPSAVKIIQRELENLRPGRPSKQSRKRKILLGAGR